MSEIHIDVDKILGARKEKKAPVVVEVSGIEFSYSPEPPEEKAPKKKPEKTPTHQPVDWTQKEQILKELEQEYRDIKRQRASLSNQYPKLVRENTGPEDLASHYMRIEAYTDQLKEIWTKKKHVELHGELPQDPRDQGIDENAENLPALREKRRRLVDKRCKLKGKIEKSIRPDSSKVQEWRLALDQADVEYNEIDQTIKRLTATNE